jgi:glycosyltransferase involved in cell wall biosynthesis
MNCLLSIIVPAYNVEKYITDTINSILNQPEFSWNYELIVINDGSTDRSSDIISSFQEKESSIKVIRQENKGLSEARNAGLGLATGKYIWFVDGDDIIAKNAFEILNSLLNKESVEIFAFDMEYINTGKRYIQNIVKKRCFYNTVQSGVVLNRKIQICATQRYVFSREFLKEHDLVFYPNIYVEDIEFNIRALCFAKNIFISDKSIYIYFVKRPGSLTSSFKIKSLYDRMIIIEELKNFREKTELTKIQKSMVNDNILTLAMEIIRAAFQNRNVQGVDIFLKENQKILQSCAKLVFDIHYLTFRKISKSFLLYFCPKLLVYIINRLIEVKNEAFI